MNRFDKLPVRWRLAITSAGLTFVILMLFAVLVEVVTVSRMRSDFDNDLTSAAQQVTDSIKLSRDLNGGMVLQTPRNVFEAATAGGAVINLLDGRRAVRVSTRKPAPDLGAPNDGVHESHGYRVASKAKYVGDLPDPVAFVEYAKPNTALSSSISRVRLFLLLGVLGGSALAFLAGLAVARRAMSPIARLTSAAKDIARTRDPAVSMPMPESDDEIADLARTLEQMLIALDSARSETQAMLERQREFVADASHELRTPLTSILTNLELLEADLEGEDRE
ncbi:MAG TPA: histidine kinase dimerization/phospho-acceptor domain-containing protein, partial [Thermoleophilaceae bacterium]